jgi:hypothetical protein
VSCSSSLLVNAGQGRKVSARRWRSRHGGGLAIPYPIRLVLALLSSELATDGGGLVLFHHDEIAARACSQELLTERETERQRRRNVPRK